MLNHNYSRCLLHVWQSTQQKRIGSQLASGVNDRRRRRAGAAHTPTCTEPGSTGRSVVQHVEQLTNGVMALERMTQRRAVDDFVVIAAADLLTP